MAVLRCIVVCFSVFVVSLMCNNGCRRQMMCLSSICCYSSYGGYHAEMGLKRFV